MPEVERTLPGGRVQGVRAMLNVAWRGAGAGQVHISIHQMLMCTQRSAMGRGVALSTDRCGSGGPAVARRRPRSDRRRSDRHSVRVRGRVTRARRRAQRSPRRARPGRSPARGGARSDRHGERVRGRVTRARRRARASTTGTPLPGLRAGAVRAADRGRDERLECVAAFARVKRPVLGRAAVPSFA